MLITPNMELQINADESEAQICSINEPTQHYENDTANSTSIETGTILNE